MPRSSLSSPRSWESQNDLPSCSLLTVLPVEWVGVWAVRGWDRVVFLGLGVLHPVDTVVLLCAQVGA